MSLDNRFGDPFFWTLELTNVSVGAATVSANGVVTALVLSNIAYKLVLSNTAAQANLMENESGYKVGISALATLCDRCVDRCA